MISTFLVSANQQFHTLCSSVSLNNLTKTLCTFKLFLKYFKTGLFGGGFAPPHSLFMRTLFNLKKIHAADSTSPHSSAAIQGPHSA